ncbi:MAG: hypothetical protein AVDCRST_MAG30-493, partial [uncultured Solirubrobacteraceae bacterium]
AHRGRGVHPHRPGARRRAGARGRPEIRGVAGPGPHRLRRGGPRGPADDRDGGGGRDLRGRRRRVLGRVHGPRRAQRRLQPVRNRMRRAAAGGARDARPVGLCRAGARLVQPHVPEGLPRCPRRQQLP